MSKSIKTSILERLPVLILLGLLAGAIGGAGIGLIQMRTSSTSTTATK